MAERGAALLSLRELARRLDVSAMAPYRHFQTKKHCWQHSVQGPANERNVRAMGCWSLEHGLLLLLLDGMLQMPEGIDPETWLAEVIGDTVAGGQMIDS